MFDGPEPTLTLFRDVEDEIAAAADVLRGAVAEGLPASEIGIFVRAPEALDRALQAAERAGLSNEATVALMHLAKGLEFRLVIVMGCDEDLLPLQSRIAEAADEGELDDIYETERQLLYVACTRARDRLVVTALAPGSEFLADLGIETTT